MQFFGVMLDMSRNAVMKPEEVKKFALAISKFGYNMLQLYTEDTYEVEGEPYFGYMRGRYSAEELRDIVSYCEKIGVEVIPCIQTLAHVNQIFKWKEYQTIRDYNDIMLVGEERTYRLIENMFKTLKKCFKTKYVHIGMDEAHMIGLGKYLDIHGYTDRFGILLEHLNKVIEIAEKYDFEPIMWSDMFFRLANKGSYYSSAGDVEFLKIKDKTPKNVGFVYWDYYGKAVNHYKKMIKSHRKFDNELWFAGGARSWKGFAPSNRYSLLTMKPAMKACKDNGINNIFITMWGDDGKECSYYSLLPSLFAIRKFYDGEYDMKMIKEEFNRITGEKYDALYSLDLVDLAIRKDNLKIGFSKAMLYSDPFNGFLDRHVISGDFQKHFKKYRTLSARYAKYKKSSAYGYIFDEESKLCKLLSVKTDLGAKTRIAYANRDVSALKNLVEDYKKAEKYLEDFYRAFKELWFKENKPQGFDIQEVRLGGLAFRLRSCRERLTEYLEGKTESIPELEEKLLDENGGCDYKESTPEFDKWNKSFTVNVVEHRPI